MFNKWYKITWWFSNYFVIHVVRALMEEQGTSDYALENVFFSYNLVLSLKFHCCTIYYLVSFYIPLKTLDLVKNNFKDFTILEIWFCLLTFFQKILLKKERFITWICRNVFLLSNIIYCRQVWLRERICNHSSSVGLNIFFLQVLMKFGINTSLKF